MQGLKSNMLPSALLVAIVAGSALLLLYRPAPTTSPPVAAVPAVLQWRGGHTQRYEVYVDSSTSIGFDTSQPPQVLALRMEGVLDYVTLETGRDNALVGMRLSAMTMTLAGQSTGQEPDRQLALPFRVRFAREGEILGFEFPVDMSGATRVVIENLVRMFQVVVRAGAQWQTEESNVSGVYTAQYTRVSPTTLKKRKLRYLRPADDMSDAIPEVISRETISIAGGGDWIAGMTLDETLFTAPSVGPTAKVRNQASLKLQSGTSRASIDRGSWTFAAGSPGVPDAGSVPVPRLSLAQSRQEVATTIASLNESVGARSGLVHRLGDLIQMHGELPQLILEILREEELEDRTRADLYLALQRAGTPQAQGVLNAVARDDSLSPEDGLRAIVALGSVTRPTDETLEQLWDTARGGPVEGEYRDLPATATLALGTIGKGLRSRGDGNYHALRADLLDGASSGRTPNQRAAALLALGNTGDADPVLRTDIVPFLDDPDPTVRDAAANSLGRLGADQAAPFLVRSYHQEPSARVRGSIARALANWEHPSTAAVESLRGAIDNEPDEKARYNLAILLVNSLESNPENKATLRKLLETERSERIRQRVADALYANGTSRP